MYFSCLKENTGGSISYDFIQHIPLLSESHTYCSGTSVFPNPVKRTLAVESAIRPLVIPLQPELLSTHSHLLTINYTTLLFTEELFVSPLMNLRNIKIRHHFLRIAVCTLPFVFSARGIVLSRSVVCYFCLIERPYRASPTESIELFDCVLNFQRKHCFDLTNPLLTTSLLCSNFFLVAFTNEDMVIPHIPHTFNTA